jgi:hypothetical protein
MVRAKLAQCAATCPFLIGGGNVEQLVVLDRAAAFSVRAGSVQYYALRGRLLTHSGFARVRFSVAASGPMTDETKR